jgi:hypothetical protein
LPVSSLLLSFRRKGVGFLLPDPSRNKSGKAL